MEKRSEIPKIDPSASSDLLSRISSFLPQLQAANEQLAASAVEEPLVDADLVEDKGEGKDDKDTESSSDDSSASDESDEDEDGSPPENKNPIIEIQLAIGDLEANPAISWLADQRTPKEALSDTAETEDAKPASQAEVTVTSLLGKRPAPAKSKGPLITELD